ncbi:MAG: zeta toxin family protein [Streptococcaceae bacterium]|jgi:predicted ABC-type ATPase|nr:zeta toxin family protein [Streptococcaceae bacterium]
MQDKELIYAKENKDEILQSMVEGIEKPAIKTAIFMAGSPGAGKTEVANTLSELYKGLVIIDADRFREKFPEYNGSNSSRFQKASSWLVEQAFRFVIANGYSFILDATFALESASKNIRRAYKNDYEISAFYVYQNPIVAWNFTKERQKVEGRVVPKERFINAYFKARMNLIKVKKEFPSEFELNIVIKDYDNNISEVHFDTDNIELILPEIYTLKELEEKLND